MPWMPEQYPNNSDSERIIPSFGGREMGGVGGSEKEGAKGSKRSNRPEAPNTATGMSSFFEFLIKAILCMQVKNFMTVYLMARGLQLTLFRSELIYRMSDVKRVARYAFCWKRCRRSSLPSWIAKFLRSPGPIFAFQPRARLWFSRKDRWDASDFSAIRVDYGWLRFVLNNSD